MKTRLYIALLIISFIFSSCGKRRIEMVSEHSDLKLPKDYKVLVNETESAGIVDFEVTVIIEFKKEAFEKLLLQIDSLSNHNTNWKFGNGLIEYSNQLNASESETISIDKKSRQLTFKFNHI